jgi:hypothetical protein
MSFSNSHHIGRVRSPYERIRQRANIPHCATHGIWICATS